MGNGLSTSLRALSDASHVGQKKEDGLPRCARNDAEESIAPSAFYFRWVAAFIGMAMLMSAPCYAQNATSSEQQMMQQLQKVLGKKASPEMMGQVIVIGSLLGCTQKTAGKEATNAFYQQMQAVGKTAEGYCKQNQPEQARALLLSTFARNKDNAVVKSALGCYDAQAGSLAAMGGARVAADAANYAKWARDPALAQKELKETDVCRGKKVGA